MLGSVRHTRSRVSTKKWYTRFQEAELAAVDLPFHVAESHVSATIFHNLLSSGGPGPLVGGSLSANDLR